MIDFEYLRKNGLLLFEYIRGSHLYGLNTENSDEDHGGIYIEPLESIMGLGIGFPEVVCDKNNDETWYSFKKYMSLLLNSNPNILESLYVPKDKILYMHPVWEEVLKERDKFITKKCFGSFMGYAKTQLEKAYKLKSRIVNPVFEKLSPLDFVYYPYQQGARKIKFWLEEKGLMQEHCGLTKVPHMDCTYNVYYDWGAHWLEKGVKSWEDFERLVKDPLEPDVKEFLNLTDAYIVYSKGELSLTEINKEKVKELYEKYKTPFKYHGIISRNGDSEEIRYSSVPFREERPMIQISYNKDEFSRHRQQYREWNLWDKEHNQERFDLACAAKYDRKNACHSARLLAMGIEIARGEGVKIDRSKIDRDFLMTIRRGEKTYEEIMEYLQGRDQEMKEAMAESTLPDEIDVDFLQNLMIKVRKEFYGL